MAKITKRENYVKILDLVKNDADLVNFINHEIELLDKKNKAPKKPTARQNENESFKDLILDYLPTHAESTISDLIENIAEFNDLSNQRVSAIVSQLVEDNSVVRVIKKRKSYFSIAE